jgi:hypothetical protein
MIIPCGQGFPFRLIIPRTGFPIPPDNSPDRDPRAREIIAYNRSEGSELADPPQETESQRIFCVCFHSVQYCKKDEDK